MDNVVFDRIREEVADNDVVVFMKGTPVFPQCGFSSVVAQVMTALGGREALDCLPTGAGAGG